jgi:hypothetical protein
VTVVSAMRVAPGVVERRSAFQRVIVGRFRGTGADATRDVDCPAGSSRMGRIVEAFRRTGADARMSSEIEVELGRKLVFLASMAAACGLARRDVGTVRRAPLGHLLIERAIAEIVAVARAHGVALESDIATQTVGAIDALQGYVQLRATLYNVASLTKPVFVELVVRLNADARLSFDEPMASAWVDPDVAADPRGSPSACARGFRTGARRRVGSSVFNSRLGRPTATRGRGSNTRDDSWSESRVRRSTRWRDGMCFNRSE